MGWLMVKEHPLVIEKGSQIDLSDVLNDPVVRFQRKYYKELGKVSKNKFRSVFENIRDYYYLMIVL
jgi:hypothetical protein